MEKKSIVAPSMDVIRLEVEDVITTSYEGEWDDEE